MYRRVESCRICSNSTLETILDLGVEALTGVFPATRDQPVTEGPLRLVRCVGGQDVCGLVQLEHSYELSEMYGDNYGYRSGLNASMVQHLRGKVASILSKVSLQPGDLVIDVGSNDSTTLQAYPQGVYDLVGIDPTGIKFQSYYPSTIRLIPDFFSAKAVRENFPGRRARVVTSFSMFYDLESPLDFMKEVHSVLADDGIWVFEQSYMPTMLETNSYDTVCHEHLEFYGLRQIKWLADHAGFVILDVEFNGVNGGSFSVTVAKQASGRAQGSMVSEILEREASIGLGAGGPYAAFADRVAASREALLAFLSRAASEGKRVAALGASTKGNVLLQYCGLGPGQIEAVGEVNPEKFGHLTPGSLIPIRPEDEVLAAGFDYLLVLPWHFRSFFLSSPKFAGRSLVFPLPELEVVRL